MRILLLLVSAACGRVSFDPVLPPDAAPDSTLDAVAPDVAPSGSGCPARISYSMPPMWVDSHGFTLVNDPADYNRLVSVSNGAAPSGSFALGFQDGDRLTGLSFEARGNSSSGLTSIRVAYQPASGAPWQTIASGEDLGRPALWGVVALPDLQPTMLAGAGRILVTLDVNGVGYFIGPVTPAIERPCNP